MAQNRKVGRRRRQENSVPQKINNSEEDLVENEYSVSDPSTMMITMTNELNEVHKEMHKEEL
jgi:hypothetical protein